MKIYGKTLRLHQSMELYLVNIKSSSTTSRSPSTLSTFDHKSQYNRLIEPFRNSKTFGGLAVENYELPYGL